MFQTEWDYQYQKMSPEDEKAQHLKARQEIISDWKTNFSLYQVTVRVSDCFYSARNIVFCC